MSKVSPSLLDLLLRKYFIMGSPYFVSKFFNRTHVVRSSKGLERVLSTVCSTMGSDLATIVARFGPEIDVVNEILQSYIVAATTRSRVTVMLSNSYEWTGWEKFQRVIIFDFSGRAGDDSSSSLAARCDYATQWLEAINSRMMM